MNPDIDAYVNGELSESAKKDFEAKMTTDPALAEAVEQQRQLVASLHFIRLRQQAKLATQVVRQVNAKKRVIGFALLAVLLAIVVAAILWIRRTNSPGDVPREETVFPAETEELGIPPIDTTTKPGNTPSRQPIAQQKGNKDEPPAIAMQDAPVASVEPGGNLRGLEPEESVDPEFAGLVNTALDQHPPMLPIEGRFVNEVELLRNGQTANAMEKLYVWDKKLGSNDTVQYLLALGLLLENKPAASALRLHALNTSKSTFAAEAKWLLALDLLLQDKPSGAKQLLRSIVKDDKHPRRQAAEVLLESLD